MIMQTFYLDNPLLLKRAIDVAEPQGEVKSTALFYVHGGGWSMGARDSFHHHLEHFSAQGYWCASVGYRLAPAAKWKTQMTDVMEGYDRFVRLLAEYGADIKQIIVLGSSAGAHLVSLLALMHPDELEVEEKIRLSGEWRVPDACVSINGPGTMERWPDMNATIRESIEKVIGTSYDESSDEFAKASPDNYVRHSCPDFLFMIVEHEKYFPHDAVYRMSEKIQQMGSKSEVVYCDGAEHGFFYGLKSPLQHKALGVLEDFVASRN
jgi:acetyl esterase/lipase